MPLAGLGIIEKRHAADVFGYHLEKTVNVVSQCCFFGVCRKENAIVAEGKRKGDTKRPRV